MKQYGAPDIYLYLFNNSKRSETNAERYSPKHIQYSLVIK